MYFLNMFHVFYLVCFLIYGVNSIQKIMNLLCKIRQLNETYTHTEYIYIYIYIHIKREFDYEVT